MWLFRKKNSLDYILQMIRLSRRVSGEIESAENAGNTKKALRYLHLLNRLGAVEFNKIKEETGSEHLMQEVLSIRSLISEATRELEMFSKFEKIKELLTRIIRLETVIEQEILEKTHNLDKYQVGRCIGTGGNSHCYEIANHPELVLITLGSTGWGSGSKRELKSANELMLLHRKIPPDVHIARIIEAGMRDGLVAMVMQRAPGHPLHDRKSDNYYVWSDRLEEFARAPQAHFNKLISDRNILHQYGLQVDPSKPDNIFYLSSIGFTFIDLNPGRYIGSLEVPLIWTYNLFTRFKKQVSTRDAKNIQKILEKLKRAGEIQNENRISQIREGTQHLLN